MRQVFRTDARHQGIDVVTSHPALDVRVMQVRIAGSDFCRFPPAQLQQGFGNLAVVLRDSPGLKIAWDGTEMQLAAIRQQGIDGVDILHHAAVTDGARAAGIIAGHAANSSPGRGRDVHGEE